MSVATALVLFDIDGTLLRGAGEHHKQALIEGIRRVTGVDTHLEGVSTSGMLDCDLIAAMLEAAGHAGRHGADMQRILHECQEVYCASCNLDLKNKVCPGVTALLSELRAGGAVLGLVTGNLSRIAWRKMELAGLRDYFSVGGFAEDAPTRVELARVAFQRAVEAELVSPRCHTSLIGDHPNDIQAGKANGFQAIGVATGLIGMDALAAAGPDVLVMTLEQLQAEQLL